MEVEVSWLAVVLAMVSSMVVGSIWYAKPVFGKKWQKLAGLSDKNTETGAMKAIGITVVVSLVTAYILAELTYLVYSFYDVSFMGAALKAALIGWIGFTATRMITHDAFEQRDTRLTLINIAHELVTLFVMAAVIGFVGI